MADDLCVPNHLVCCLDTIEKNPAAVLVYPKTRFIDENGELLDIEAPGWNLQSEKAPERLRYVIFAGHWVNPHYGLIRASALSRTKLLSDYPSGNSRLLGELSWMAEFIMGEHSRICLPGWEINRDYLFMIARSKVSLREKAFLPGSVPHHLRWNKVSLRNELALGFRMYCKKILS